MRHLTEGETTLLLGFIGSVIVPTLKALWALRMRRVRAREQQEEEARDYEVAYKELLYYSKTVEAQIRALRTVWEKGGDLGFAMAVLSDTMKARPK